MDELDLVAGCVCGMNNMFNRRCFVDSSFVLQRHTKNKGVCQFWNILFDPQMSPALGHTRTRHGPEWMWTT